METISYRMLKDRGACGRALAEFEVLFAKGPVKLTLGNMNKAVTAGLDVTWLAGYLPAGMEDEMRAEMDKIDSNAGDHDERVTDNNGDQYCPGCLEYEKKIGKIALRFFKKAPRLMTGKGGR